MAKKSRSSRPTSRRTQAQATPEHGNADLVTFRVAQKLAAESTIAQLTEAAVDLDGEKELYQNLKAVRLTLERAHKANGATGVYTIGELLEHLENDGPDPEGVTFNLTTHYAESGYLYGLAIGLQLAKAGAR